jgi:hypothetical protein
MDGYLKDGFLVVFSSCGYVTTSGQSSYEAPLDAQPPPQHAPALQPMLPSSHTLAHTAGDGTQAPPRGRAVRGRGRAVGEIPGNPRDCQSAFALFIHNRLEHLAQSWRAHYTSPALPLALELGHWPCLCKANGRLLDGCRETPDMPSALEGVAGLLPTPQRANRGDLTGLHFLTTAGPTASCASTYSNYFGGAVSQKI